MAQRYVISGGRFIDPANSVDRVVDLAIADGKVVAIDRLPRGFKTASQIDATGRWVIPGLIDLRARVRPSQAEESLVSASELRAAVAGGVTTVVAAPEDGVLMDSSAAAHRLQQRSRDLELCRVIPQGALTRQLEGKQLSEMAALKRAGCELMGNGRVPVGSQMMRNALDYAANFDLPVVVHCEVPGLAGGCIHEGATSLRLGLPGIPAAAEEAAVGRDLALARLTGAQVHFAGISTADAVQLLTAAKKGGLPVTADVAIHHFSDHSPKAEDSELLPFAESEPGIAGVESLLPLLLELVRKRRLPLERALAAVTAAPAKLLQGSRGQLAEGAVADLCIVDPDQIWQLQPSQWQSSGRNSPFGGRQLQGRVTHTLVAGNMVYRLDQGQALFPTLAASQQ